MLATLTVKGTGNSSIAGNLGVGMTNPSEKLDVLGNIKTSGCLYYANASLGNCASDERIKKDVHDFDLGIDTLLGLRPVYFKYNGLAGFRVDGKEQMGFIAQEVEQVAPSLVKKQMVTLHPGDQQKTEIKGVDYGAMTFVLINAVRELHDLWSSDSKEVRAELAAQKAENALLKARLEAIEAQLRSPASSR
ncbi:MAG: hypothetical protein EOP06_23210 [Proteobacteria bacterium]|nr:MAG: hypothetical protein EOP06_23210 [Pseudomonadota bacterium]